MSQFKDKSLSEMVEFIYHRFLMHKTNSQKIEEACEKCIDKFGGLGLSIGKSITEKIRGLGEDKVKEMYLKLQKDIKPNEFEEIELK